MMLKVRQWSGDIEVLLCPIELAEEAQGYSMMATLHLTHFLEDSVQVSINMWRGFSGVMMVNALKFNRSCDLQDVVSQNDVSAWSCFDYVPQNRMLISTIVFGNFPRLSWGFLSQCSLHIICIYMHTSARSLTESRPRDSKNTVNNTWAVK